MITTLPALEDREYWANRKYIDERLKLSLLKADVIFTPLENFRENIDIVFHQGTTNLYQYLNDNLPSSIVTEICAHDVDYGEIALYSKEFRLGKILLSSVAAPLVIGLLTNYVYDELKAKDKDTVSISLAIEMKDCKTYSVDFEGSAKDFSALQGEVNKVLNRCNNGKD